MAKAHPELLEDGMLWDEAALTALANRIAENDSLQRLEKWKQRLANSYSQLLQWVKRETSDQVPSANAATHPQKRVEAMAEECAKWWSPD